jgi:hypothetical protein
MSIHREENNDLLFAVGVMDSSRILKGNIGAKRDFFDGKRTDKRLI